MQPWTQSGSQLMPQTCRHVTPKGGGLRKPPFHPLHLPFPSPPSHSRGTGSYFSQSLHGCSHLHTQQRPSILGVWHGPLCILPGLAAARGACPPSRLHSGTRHQLDTNTNQQEEPIQVTVRDGSGLRPWQALLGNLFWVLPSTKGSVGPFYPTPIGLSTSTSNFCLPGSPCLQKDPICPSEGPTLAVDTAD